MGLKPEKLIQKNSLIPTTNHRTKPWLLPLGLGDKIALVPSANIYSLVETAKANDIDPFGYLRNVFEKLPKAQTETDFVKLLSVKID